MKFFISQDQIDLIRESAATKDEQPIQVLLNEVEWKQRIISGGSDRTDSYFDRMESMS